MAFHNVLHTHSGYAKGAIDKTFIANIGSGKSSVDSKIQQVKAKELTLYQQFGKNNYQEFITELRDLFNSNDRDVIERFEANKLSERLARFASENSELLDQQVEIKVDMSKLNKIGLQLTDKGKTEANLHFEATFNHETIKTWFNENFKGHRFITESKSMKAMDEMLNKMAKAGIITISTRASQESSYTVYHKSKIPNYPWGILKADIEFAEDYEAAKDDLIKALNHIKHFIFFELGAGASPELLKAMQAVWTRNFSQSWSDPIRFFAGTTKRNFISVVQGSLGEFQTAVIFEYLRNKKMSAPAMAMIQGNIYRNGEQGKTDVQIFESLGIQVKNMNTIEQNGKLTLLRDLETNIHPDKFAKYLDDHTATHFLDFLANYYFNLSYQGAMQARMNWLRYRLSYWLTELMNMAIVDSAVGDTVSFYMVGGHYLIPCSALLEASKELGLANNISIESTYKGFDDTGYARHSTKPKADGSGSTSLYSLYWRKDENNEWQPTGQNIGEYHNLIGKRISIRTHFNLMDEIERYALW